MKYYSFLIFLILAVFTSSVISQETLDYFGPVKDLEHADGYREYVELGCYQCHGFQGQGATSPKLVQPLIPYEGFANQVRRPRNVMPAYSSNVLTDQDLRKIYSYLQSIPSSPDPADIPLLSKD
jgi:mono/diheme cytochrome c family protein